LTKADGSLQASNNLSDLAAPATARTNLGLGTAATMTPASLAADSAFSGMYAPKASPTFTGTVTVPTPVNSTDAATKAYVDQGGAGVSWQALPIFLSTGALQIATGAPSMLVATSGSISVPGWSMSGNTAGQSIAGMVTGLPAQCAAVKIELITTNSSATTGLYHVWQIYGGQPNEGDSLSINQIIGDPRIKASPASATLQTILLEEYLPVIPSRPLFLRIARQPADTADTWTGSVIVAGLRVTPLPAPSSPIQIQAQDAYNSWPMITAVGSKLVCMFSRGAMHGQPDITRQIWGSSSTDGGQTWSASSLKIDNASLDDSTVGRGLDSSGNLLLWTRQDTASNAETHSLYRSTDGGNTFSLLSSPTFANLPIQISDIFSVPTVGLMAFFHTSTPLGTSTSWGIVKSTDDGNTWTQTTVETGLTTDTWPTEISGAYIGGGKIIAIARSNSNNTTTIKSQFQITSTDYGATWTKAATNITDVTTSTPSLIYDGSAGLLSLYYYRRGSLASLRRRVVSANTIFSSPLSWPDPTIIATGSTSLTEAGNVNACVLGSNHIAAFYNGPDAGNTGIYATILAAPTS
ncbi:MAG TPA: sialidase family protein, partial [Candidatus Saccharimonadales bacterium]